jgi:hypothetical protein
MPSVDLPRYQEARISRDHQLTEQWASLTPPQINNPLTSKATNETLKRGLPDTRRQPHRNRTRRLGCRNCVRKARSEINWIGI